ncbi:anti-anti-sigma factor [Aquibacillus albus]|uniref:Anti-sigma factor antagonist n=2 Tax=Aquibacillus albus TaxID=1168171 RepID=A0ABS2N594_9BACI|nr:anti-anti-sigma factor [Aquibacillus albus]
MEVKKERSNNICTLYVDGVLDYSTMEPFVEKVRSIEEGIEKVIVDFTDLEFIDSTGIGAIINLVHEANTKQFEVELCGIIDEIKDLFETIGVFQIMEALQEESD